MFKSSNNFIEPKRIVTAPEESVDIRLIRAHADRDYRKIYDTLVGLLNAGSDDYLARYMYNNKGHSIYFIEAVAFYNDRPTFDRIYNIAASVETDPYYKAAITANKRAWDYCKGIYLEATRVYLSNPSNNSIQMYKQSCPDLKYIY